MCPTVAPPPNRLLLPYHTSADQSVLGIRSSVLFSQNFTNRIASYFSLLSGKACLILLHMPRITSRNSVAPSALLSSSLYILLHPPLLLINLFLLELLQPQGFKSVHLSVGTASYVKMRRLNTRFVRKELHSLP